MKKVILLLLLPLFLFGCAATPPGKLTDNDFAIKTISISPKVPEALSSFRAGLRFCGTKWGVPECSPLLADGSSFCDIYGPGPYGGRSDWVVGKIDFIPKEEGSEVVFRIQHYIAFKEERMKQWELLMTDRAKEACP